jgi:hypothetical protein
MGRAERGGNRDSHGLGVFITYSSDARRVGAGVGLAVGYILSVSPSVSVSVTSIPSSSPPNPPPPTLTRTAQFHHGADALCRGTGHRHIDALCRMLTLKER